MTKTNLFGASLCTFGLVVLSGCAMQEKKVARSSGDVYQLRECPWRPARAELREG